MYKTLFYQYKWQLMLVLPISFLLGIVRMLFLTGFSHALSGARVINIELVYFFLAIFCLLAVSYYHGRLEISLLSKATRYIQMTMINRVACSPYHQLEAIGLPKILATLTEDVRVAAKLFDILPKMLVSLSTILFGFTYLAYLSSSLLLGTFTITFFGIASVFLIGWFTQKKRLLLRNTVDDINRSYQDLVLGAKEINLNKSRKNFLLNQISIITKKIEVQTQFVQGIRVFSEQWIQFVMFAILGTLILYAKDGYGVTQEVIISFVMVILFLMPAIFHVIESISNILEAKVAFSKIEKLGLSAISETPIKTEMKKPATKKHKVEKLVLHNIHYSYKPEIDTPPFSLGPICAEFNAGESTLIIGGNGSGKSTLMKVICGLYPSDTGEIYLLADNKKIDIRNKFSYINPSFWLFEDVIDSEGALCRDDVINDYLVNFHLEKSVYAENGKLSTLELSHGQRKRLALIQMLIEDKDLILLDEWAADQDPSYKKIFYTQIIPQLKNMGKIVIFVSHDDSYYMQTADKGFQLEEGELKSLQIQVKELHPLKISDTNLLTE